jgi:adenylate kinase family enzyme
MSAARVNILGASGVGKTTLGRALAERLGVPHVDSDGYYHLPTDPPYQLQRSPEERRALLERDLVGLASWVLTGGAATWIPAPRLDVTLYVFLTLETERRIERLVLRERAMHGERILAGGDMAEMHAEFLAWTRGYDDGTAEGTNTRPAHEAALAAARCPVLRLDGALPLDEAVARVLVELASPAA